MTGAEELAIALAGPAVAAIGVVYTIVQTRRKASADQLAALDRKVDGKASAAAVEQLGGKLGAAEDRIITIEETMAHMPDRDTTHRLELAISELRGDMKELAASMKPVTAISNRLQDLMLEEGRQRR